MEKILVIYYLLIDISVGELLELLIRTFKEILVTMIHLTNLKMLTLEEDPLKILIIQQDHQEVTLFKIQIEDQLVIKIELLIQELMH